MEGWRKRQRTCRETKEKVWGDGDERSRVFLRGRCIDSEVLCGCVGVLTDSVALLFSVPRASLQFCGGVVARHHWKNNTSPAGNTNIPVSVVSPFFFFLKQVPFVPCRCCGMRSCSRAPCHIRRTTKAASAENSFHVCPLTEEVSGISRKA